MTVILYLPVDDVLDLFKCVLDVQTNSFWFVLFVQSVSSLKEVLGQLLDAVLTYTEHGRLISELFQRLPSKVVVVSVSSEYTHKHIILLLFKHLNILFQQYPDYYAIIKEPIDLKTIAHRIQVSYYYDHILLQLIQYHHLLSIYTEVCVFFPP